MRGLIICEVWRFTWVINCYKFEAIKYFGKINRKYLEK